MKHFPAAPPDLPTVGMTCIRLAVPPSPPRAPWVAARALDALRAVGAVPGMRPDILGTGHGEPLLTRHGLTWHDRPVHLEYHRFVGGDGEVALDLPPWEELGGQGDGPPIDAGAFWDLVDAVAAAVDAGHGGIGDDDAVIPREPEGPGGRGLIARLLPTEPARRLGGPGAWRECGVLEESALVVLVRDRPGPQDGLGAAGPVDYPVI